MKKQKNSVTVGRKMGILEWQARFVPGLIQGVSELTRKDLLNRLGMFGRAMERLGLQSIKEINADFVGLYFEALQAKGISARRIAAHAQALRMLCNIMGMGEIVPSNHELGCARRTVKRTDGAL